MHMGAYNGEGSHTLNKSLNEWSMRKGTLILKASKTDFMPKEMRNINLAFGRLIEMIHEINA